MWFCVHTQLDRCGSVCIHSLIGYSSGCIHSLIGWVCIKLRMHTETHPVCKHTETHPIKLCMYADHTLSSCVCTQNHTLSSCVCTQNPTLSSCVCTQNRHSIKLCRYRQPYAA